VCVVGGGGGEVIRDGLPQAQQPAGGLGKQGHANRVGVPTCFFTIGPRAYRTSTASSTVAASTPKMASLVTHRSTIVRASFVGSSSTSMAETNGRCARVWPSKAQFSAFTLPWNCPKGATN